MPLEYEIQNTLHKIYYIQAEILSAEGAIYQHHFEMQ